VILLKCKLIFHNGQKIDDFIESPENLITDLQNRIEWLHSIPISDILDFIEAFGNLIKENSTFTFASTSKHLSDFFKRDNLQRELDLSLRGNYLILDKFVKLEKGGNKLYHTQPRGVAVHWIAGNVDELGIFSIIQALITKNVSLIKAPSNYENLVDLVNLLKRTKTEKLSGEDLVKTISIIYLERDDEKNQKLISESADVRIIWGGLDAVSSIISIPKKPFCEDIVFGPKYSYVILDEEATSKSDLALKLAFDISMFDQNACSSPHTIFIETKNKEILNSFGEKLSIAMDKVNKLIPKKSISESKAMEIHEIRSENEFSGTVFSSKDTSWTVVISENDKLEKPCFSRVVFVKSISNATNLLTFNNKKIQTIGIVMNKEKRLKLIDTLSLHGGDRSPTIGDMSTYENPWDGMFVMDRLVRWVTTYD
jgi:hypothetical protein